MISPKETLKAMKGRRYGARGMERLVKDCCADNPDCPFQEECKRRYDIFVNGTEMPVKSELAKKNAAETRRRNYHKLRKARVPARIASRNTTGVRTATLLAGLSGDRYASL